VYFGRSQSQRLPRIDRPTQMFPSQSDKRREKNYFTSRTAPKKNNWKEIALRCKSVEVRSEQRGLLRGGLLKLVPRTVTMKLTKKWKRGAINTTPWNCLHRVLRCLPSAAPSAGVTPPGTGFLSFPSICSPVPLLQRQFKRWNCPSLYFILVQPYTAYCEY